MLRIYGENILTTEDEEWKRHRRIAIPAFGRANTGPRRVVISGGCFDPPPFDMALIPCHFLCCVMQSLSPRRPARLSRKCLRRSKRATPAKVDILI